jgi:hypothetical protein
LLRQEWHPHRFSLRLPRRSLPPGADGQPPAGGPRQSRGVLDGYFKKISAEKSDNAQALDGEYLAPADWLPIRLQTAAERAQAGAADPEELLRLVKQRAQDPRLFDEFPPVFFSGIVSTNALDSYSTRMHRSSLENFAADLTEGRVLLDSHDSSTLGILLAIACAAATLPAGATASSARRPTSSQRPR